jgi:hypothetical protein
MKRLLALLVASSVGCGTILNNGPTTIIPPPGATVDGFAGPLLVSQRTPHEIVYPDGRRCIVESHISALYIVGDIFIFFFLGLIVDAATGHWYVLSADACPGVIVN